MYDFVEGELVSKSPTQVVLNVGGVGYRLIVPVSTFDALPQSEQVRLFAHLYVREDDQRLYGFATQDERRLFVRLIALSGVGPNTAIAVLNGMSVDAFRQAVADEQLGEICRIKGIGRKTAERIVVELRDEMTRDLAERPAAAGRTAPALTSDAVAAMLALGYARNAARKAVERAFEKLGRDASLENIVREALQQMV